MPVNQDRKDEGCENSQLFSFPSHVSDVVHRPIEDLYHTVSLGNAQDLYVEFDSDFLYLPATQKKKLAKKDRSKKVELVFGGFDRLVDHQVWTITSAEVLEFFRSRVDEEQKKLRFDGTEKSYLEIIESTQPEQACKFLMSQIALDCLTEASPLTRMLPGSFGELQMAIFKIVSDEYGGGNLNEKHSVLFQKALKSIGMPEVLEFYRPFILNTVYMYLSYVNRVAADKRLYLQFFGFLFVYEACLISATQQQGRMLRKIFGNSVDSTYFDAHVQIDQEHGVWVYEKMLVPLIKSGGSGAAREILRGYHDTNILLSLCDYEVMKAIRALDFPILSHL
ncbi:iron-containing redox enzyme family protein [Acidisoma sp. 7E03]